MGSFLDKPKTDKDNDFGEGNNLNFAASSMQGWRCRMEDASYARIGLGKGFEDWSAFAVFDGHAGSKVSQHCAKYLLEDILRTEEFKRGDYVNGIRTSFLRFDEAMRKLPEMQNDENRGGTTVVCAFISPTQVYIANCGDSRAVLSRGGVPMFATQDHKPVLPEEKERICNAGGSVMVQRVNGALAVSRALGDYDFKRVKEKGQCEQLVSPEPEIFCQSRQDADEFLLLACDGIWDVMSNEDVCSFVHSRLKVTDDLVDIANQVIDSSLHKGSRDNMSVILVTFPGAPKPTVEDIEADKRFDKELEKATRDCLNELYSDNVQPDYQQLLHEVHNQEDNLRDVPPGAGLYSKYAIIERIYKEVVKSDPANDTDESFFEDLIDGLQ